LRQSSLVIRISLALAGIVALAALSMVTSYWISDQADNDAYAINAAGSLRMQTYRLGLLTQTGADTGTLQTARENLDQAWRDPVFTRLAHGDPALAEQLDHARSHWEQLEPQVLTGQPNNTQALLDEQVERIEQLVTGIQRHAERNAQLLRLVQVLALFSVLGLAAIVIYWLRTKVELPLSELTRLARRVGEGDFTGRATPRQMNELGILAQTFNHMSDAIAQMHSQMEQRIHDQTEELQRSNTALQFLYDTAKTIIEQEDGKIDYQPIMSHLAELVHADDIELCLITETGDTPYLQVLPEQSVHDVCVLRNCDDCLSGELLTRTTADQSQIYRYSFPMVREQKHYGVLVCRTPVNHTLDQWQQQLIESVADQLALALSLQAQEDNARRLTLVHERTVIARELHDSLAQALSYLKIQVARLNRALAKDDKATLEDVSKELQEGLNSAYRQLRELLTTFRLKVDGPGFLGALQSSVKQLDEQTDMELHFNYTLGNVPLSPNEEVHLLQIVREATQNAIHHSGGNNVHINLYQSEDKTIHLSIEDDGRGISANPEKLNHYGLAIMQERGKNLGGNLSIRNVDSGGVGVYFTFNPSYLQQQNVFARDGGQTSHAGVERRT
jgi:two-component system, NarL family, nitrate/nitrite sensor histidine kinase NarX